MTEKEPTGKVEVAHITGVQGIRAAMEVLAREAAGEGETDVPLLGERRLTHFFALTRPQWAADRGEEGT